MALISTTTGAAIICGQCSARYEFAQSFDRRLPLSAAIAAGWGTARNDKGDFGYACPECIAFRDASTLVAVPDDPPRSPQSPKPSSHSLPSLPARPPKRRRRYPQQV
jgi:hypothetical protein